MYQWKSKYSGMEVSQLKKLKEMESELSQYKKIVAELTLQNTDQRIFLGSDLI